ncbi:MAG TPA: copper-binding protein, partial [Marinobacter hydrocarbonoclasticus]|nr:copper-binding protein [Marinobacter nauticus]
YMYSMHNLLENNVTRGTRTGYALMQSKYLKVFNNRSENDENYGILMNFITNSELRNNVVTGVSQG